MTADLRARAKDIINQRRARAKYFPDGMFNEFAWEILLLLYASDETSRPAASIGENLKSPPSTTRRWVDYLVSEGFISSHSSRGDDGGLAISLTLEGRSSIEAYLAEVLERA